MDGVYSTQNVFAGNTNLLKIPRVRGSLLNNTGYLVAAEAAGPPSNWTESLCGAPFLCNNSPLSGPSFSAHTWFGNAQNYGRSVWL